MKSLLLLGIVATTGGGFWLRETNIRQEAVTRQHAAAMLAEMQAADARPQGSSKTWRQLPDGKWVNADRHTSAMQAVGGNGGQLPATPAQSDVEKSARKAWGWGKSGTALDQR